MKRLSLFAAFSALLSITACGSDDESPGSDDSDADHHVGDGDGETDDGGPVDTTPPDAPTLTGTTPPSPSSNAVNPAISGTAEADALVRIYRNNTCTGVLAAYGASGSGTFTLATTGGSANATSFFAATATDAAGNTSPCSATISYVHDGQAPAEPVFVSSQPASPSNSELSPLLEGSGDSGTTIDIYTTSDCTGVPVATTTAVAEAFSVEVTVIANTSTTFHATSTDPHGNVTSCSASSLTYVHDDIAPSTPSNLTTAPVSPSNSAAPTVSGTLDDDTVRFAIYDDAGCTGTALADGAGTTTFSVATSIAATTTFYAVAFDAAGNASACSAGVTYVFDDVAPNAPAVAFQEPSPGNLAVVHVDVTGEPNATVTFYGTTDCTGSLLATIDLDSAGELLNVIYSTTANAQNILSATLTDAAGNTSTCSSAAIYVHDAIAPAAPTVNATPATPSVSTRPTLAGTAETGATVRLYATADCTGDSVSTSSTGTYAFEGSVAPGATVSFSADATDAAGNVSPCSAQVDFVNTLPTAGEVFVSLDAEHSTAGSATWHNAGTIGDFVRVGSPTLSAIAGIQALSLNAAATLDAYQSPSPSPAGLNSTDATLTIEAWVRNPVVGVEETIVAWGDRAATNASIGFTYGSDPTTGAIDYDGGASEGWSTVPTAATWHYLVYTYDGDTKRLYLDGELQSTTFLGQGVLNTSSVNKVTVGAQLADAIGTLSTTELGSLAIARLRIHDGVLSDTAIENVYDTEGRVLFPGNECALSPCANGGDCIDGINAFTCDCTDGFGGPTCALDCSACAAGQTCDGAGPVGVCHGIGYRVTNVCAATTCEAAPIEQPGVGSTQDCWDACTANADCQLPILYEFSPGYGFCNLYDDCSTCQVDDAAPNVKYQKVVSP